MTIPYTPALPRLTVLIVDDEEVFRKSVLAALAKKGDIRPHGCETGEEAVEFLKRNHVDVVLLDYRLPGMSGLNVLQWMHEQKIETPVVMMTGAGSETIAVETMKLGAYDYVRKDQLDFGHLPILVQGVHERYMFKKEKEWREAAEMERAKGLAAIETFHSTLASVSQIVNSSLTLMAVSMEQREHELIPAVEERSREKFRQGFAEMRKQLGVVSSAIRSMLSAANALHGNFMASERTIETLQNPRVPEADRKDSAVNKNS